MSAMYGLVQLHADQEDAYKAAPLGLLVLVVLGIASYALFRSMSKHLRKVNGGFVDQATPARRTHDFPVSPGFPVSRVLGPDDAGASPNEPQDTGA